MDTGGDAGIAGDDSIRHFGQADPSADNTELDMALDDFGERLGARALGLAIACRHAVADVEVGDNVGPGTRHAFRRSGG